MNYNIHPLFVHFPIALLFVYSVIKVLPLQKWLPKVSWKDIERTLLLFGVLGAFVASTTGESAEHLVRPNHAIVEMHSLFAATATWLYGLLLLGEILVVCMPVLVSRIRVPNVVAFLLFSKKILTSPFISSLLAVLGLIAISLTGVLGGVMVYGASADPISGIVLRLLGLSI